MSGAIDFGIAVRVAGQDVDPITLEGATITYGAVSPDSTADPGTAYLELVTLDALPTDAAGWYPAVGYGSSIPSGFVDTYADEYAGPRTSPLRIGAPVTIDVTTPSGFTAHYVDTYAAGWLSRRFTGTVAAIDYRPASIAVTAVDACEPWTRALVIPAAWPREPERDRVNRIAAAAGLSLDVVGDSTATVGPGPNSDTPVPAWSLLARVAADCGAVLYATRNGIVTYRTRAASTGRAVVDAYPAAVLLDPLTMTQEAAAVVNVARVTHPDDTTGQGTTIVVEDTGSKGEYGHRERSWNVDLDAAGAAAFAARQVANRKAPAWAMPSMRLMLGLAADAGGNYPANVVALLDADLDDEVSLVGLLPAAPVPSYRSRVLGVVETLAVDEWALDYYLDPLGWSQTAPGDAYVPPPPLAPSKDPQLAPGDRAGEFRVRNYDGNLDYVASPLAGSGGTAVLDSARGVFTVDTTPAAWSVATTEPGSVPGYMERKPYTYTTVDRGRWETTTRTRDESYPARAVVTDVLGDPPVNGQCPPGWYPVLGPGGAPRCQTQVTEWVCDYGGTLEGTICRKIVTYTESTWVPNPVTERDATPAGYVDTGTEWVKTR